MVDLNQESVDRLRTTLDDADERTLDDVLDAACVGEVADVSDGRARMLVVGSHPHLRDSNAVHVDVDRFDDEPSGYYWLDLEDCVDPEVRSVSTDESLQRVMGEYHRVKRERLDEDRAEPPAESSVESGDLL